jgi:hypothetical protein
MTDVLIAGAPGFTVGALFPGSTATGTLYLLICCILGYIAGYSKDIHIERCGPKEST